MVPFSHLLLHIKRFTFLQKKLYALAVVLFFFAFYDGIISYVTPLLMDQNGLSKTTIGLIMGSSSVAGAGFDFLLSRMLKNVHYRRIYLFMFACSFGYPLLLWKAHAIWLFLIAMALWGLYYDLEAFGSFDFVSHEQEPKEHASSFGILSVFSTLGYLIAPLVTGLLIKELVDWKPLLLSWILLSFSLCIYGLFLMKQKNSKHVLSQEHQKQTLSLVKETHVWKQIGIAVFPVLSLTVLLNTIDATFWTIGPLVAEQLRYLHPLNGLFITMYMLPSLFVGWFVGSAAQRIGKKKTAFFSYIAGAGLLCLLPFIHNGILILLAIFISSMFMSFSWPSIKGVYADYISETAQREKEIEGLEDFAANTGYVIGPIISGFLAEHVGNVEAFSIIGGAAAFIASILFLLTPKRIIIPQS